MIGLFVKSAGVVCNTEISAVLFGNATLVRRWYLQAFDVATSHFGIPKVLEAADMVVRKVPDRLAVMTYLFQLQAYFTHEQECGSALSDSAVDSVDAVLATDGDDDMRQFADSTSSNCPQPVQESSVSYSKKDLLPKPVIVTFC